MRVLSKRMLVIICIFSSAGIFFFHFKAASLQLQTGTKALDLFLSENERLMRQRILIIFPLSLFGDLKMIPSSCHNEDLYLATHNTWNAAQTSNHIQHFPFFPLRLSRPPSAARGPGSRRKWQRPAGQQSPGRMPDRSAHRKCLYMFSPETRLDDTRVRDCQSETECHADKLAKNLRCRQKDVGQQWIYWSRVTNWWNSVVENHW